MKSIYFIDFDARGHHLEFVMNVMEGVDAFREAGLEPVFYLTKDYKEKGSILLNVIESYRIKVFFCETNSWKEKWTAYFGLFRMVSGQDFLFFLHINPFLPFLTLLPQRSFYSGGIYLFPFFREDSIFQVSYTKLRVLRRYLILLFMLVRQNPSELYFLNDTKAAKRLDECFGMECLGRMIIDPVRIETPKKKECLIDLRREYKIDPNRKIVLFFGEISERKGADNLLNLLKNLKNKAKNYHFLIIGRCLKYDQKPFESEIANVCADNKHCRVSLDIGQFVPSEIVQPIFQQSDIVLALYNETEGSSGIAGRAALAGKAVIAPTKGLLWEILEKWGIGVGIPYMDGEVLVAGLEEAKRKIIDTDKPSLSPQAFCENLKNNFMNYYNNEHTII